MHNFKKYEPIKFGDPGKLIYLVSSLYDRSTLGIQKKVNQYLIESTDSMVAFLVQNIKAKKKAVVRVIGEHILENQIEMEYDRAFLLQAKNQNGVCIEEKDLEPKLKKELKLVLGKRFFNNFENCFVFPVFDATTKKLILYAVFVNYPKTYAHIDVIKGVADGCFRYTLPVIRSKFLLDEVKRNRKMCCNIFKSVVGLTAHAENEYYTYKGIQKEAVKLFKSEHCVVHFTDESFAYKLIDLYTNREPKIEEDEKANIHKILLPETCLIARAVSESGQVINCTNANNEPYAHADLIKEKDGVCLINNSLSFPIIIDNQIKGVIEVFNKITEDNFTAEDEEYACAFGHACGLVMKSVKIYGRVKEKYSVRSRIDCLVLKKVKFPDCIDLNFDFTNTLPFLDKIHSFDFNPYCILEKDILTAITFMLCGLNIFPVFRIEKELVCRFICCLLELTPNLPFHNVYLSFNSFHFIVMLVSQCKLQAKYKFTVTEIFMLLIASLAQDLGWKGPTSEFQYFRGSSLAALYTSPGMIEKRLVVSQVIRILTNSEVNIFKEMNIEHTKICMELLHDLILATDISHHIAKIPVITKMIKNGFDKKNIKHRKILMELIMATALFSIYAKPSEVQVNLSERIANEFYRQGDLSKMKGGIDFSMLDKNPEVLTGLILFFITSYCIPAFTLLSQIISPMEEMNDRMQKSLKMWENIKEDYLDAKRLQNLQLMGDQDEYWDLYESSNDDFE